MGRKRWDTLLPRVSQWDTRVSQFEHRATGKPNSELIREYLLSPPWDLGQESLHRHQQLIRCERLPQGEHIRRPGSVQCTTRRTCGLSMPKPQG
jgi:hypothetical protein